MANPQPVQMVASITKERSHEVRAALGKMGIEVDQNDLVDLDKFDFNDLKKKIAEDAPPVKYKPDEETKKASNKKEDND